MSTSPAPYFFMSYSREDTVKQRRIIKELRERGVAIWVDVENLVPGTPTWEREIEKAIRNSTGIIVLLSPESNNSEWVRREISFGEQHRKRIFPVLIEGDDDTSTPLRLANHQRVDLRTRFESGLDELANALKNYIKVKDEIASQSQVNLKKPQLTKPVTTLDWKKFGLPALIALIGLFCLGGGVLGARYIGGFFKATETVTATQAPVTKPGVTLTITATEPVITQDEPTGKIVYTCQVKGLNDYEICSVNADGTGKRQITDSNFSSYYPSVSPDGNSVIYSSNETGKFQLYEWNFFSKEKTSIVIDSLKKNDLDAPEISPDGTLIVFANHTQKYSEIWLANRNGTNPRKLYSSKNRDAVAPTWSPDGTRILFAMGNDGNNKLYIISANGGDPVLVKDSISTRGRSDWSVHDQISFDQGGPFMHEAYLMNVDGSDLHQVSKPGMNSQGASLSPDGNWIAFTAYTNVAGKDQNSCEIFIMRVNGTDQRQLTDNKYCDFQPRWGN